MQQSRSIKRQQPKQFVSRAALKLASITEALKLSFVGKVVLDVGSSTGGFTDFALTNGATRVIAVDKGTRQMNRILALDQRIELHEKTDIKELKLQQKVDLVLIDLSFISLRSILPALKKQLPSDTEIVAMVKPQFETQDRSLFNRGILKNERIRRQVLAEFETWLKAYFVIQAKADSKLPGKKGNVERFYKLLAIH